MNGAQDTSAFTLTPADVIDDDTLAATVALWQATPALMQVFASPPRTGRQKSTQPGQDIEASGLYAVLDSKLLRRELTGSDKAGAAPWFDYRSVTITIYGVRADVVQGVSLVLAAFDRQLGVPGKATLSYPSGARFMRWWPIGNAVIEEDKDSKAGKDVWKGVIQAEVWSIRAQ